MERYWEVERLKLGKGCAKLVQKERLSTVAKAHFSVGNTGSLEKTLLGRFRITSRPIS